MGKAYKPVCRVLTKWLSGWYCATNYSARKPKGPAPVCFCGETGKLWHLIKDSRHNNGHMMSGEIH